MPAWIRSVARVASASKDFTICDGGLIVSLPTGFQTEDEDGTTIARDLHEDGAILRFSVMSIEHKIDVASQRLGEEYVRRLAEGEHRMLIAADRLSYYEYSEPVREGSVKAVMHYWVAGIDDTVVVCSCWVKRSLLPSRSRSRVVAAGRNAVRSLRWDASFDPRVQGPGVTDIVDLTPQHSAWLEQRHAQASEAMAKASAGADRLLGYQEDLDRIQRFLDQGAHDAPQPEVLEGLGIALGDLLARRLGLRWCTIEDRSGSTPALRYRDSSIVVYATEMILKRIERGEPPIVRELFDSTVKYVEDAHSKVGENTQVAGS